MRVECEVLELCGENTLSIFEKMLLDMKRGFITMTLKVNKSACNGSRRDPPQKFKISAALSSFFCRIVKSSGVEAKRGVEFRHQNSAESVKWSVLTIGSHCYPSVSVIQFPIDNGILRCNKCIEVMGTISKN